MNNSCTPTMADFREAYVLARTRDGLRTESVIAAARADANRAIAAHDAEVVAEATLQLRREAKAEALREAAERVSQLRDVSCMARDGMTDRQAAMERDYRYFRESPVGWLLDRADRMGEWK